MPLSLCPSETIYKHFVYPLQQLSWFYNSNAGITHQTSYLFHSQYFPGNYLKYTFLFLLPASKDIKNSFIIQGKRSFNYNFTILALFSPKNIDLLTILFQRPAKITVIKALDGLYGRSVGKAQAVRKIKISIEIMLKTQNQFIIKKSHNGLGTYSLYYKGDMDGVICIFIGSHITGASKRV